MSSVKETQFDDKTLLDTEAIKKILPHRYPFLLIDRITALTPGKHAIGEKSVTVNEPFFQGHFPVKAIMPGVLIVESMAQVGGVMMLTVPESKGKLAYIGGIEKVRFRKPVLPGDHLVNESFLTRVRGDMGKIVAIARVNGAVVAEGEILFALISVEQNS